jgi:putative chitinase
VTVSPGDTLSAIAAAHGTTVEAIAQANGIENPDLIHPGQTLTVPDGGSSAGSASDPGQQYLIQSGDTLTAIAAAHGTTVDAIVQANGIENPDLIHPGQTLTVPDGGSSAGSASDPGQQYLIQSGDTLTAIAAAHGTTVDAIVQANGIENPDLIITGDKLNMPGGLVPENDEVSPSWPPETPQFGDAHGLTQ